MNCILLDVGNVILYDYPVIKAYLIEFHRLLNIESMSLFNLAVIYFKNNLINNETDWFLKIKEFNDIDLEEINSTAWGNVLQRWNEINVPIEENINILKKYSDKFTYVICANQPAQTRALLTRYCAQEWFKIILLDDELNFSKPDICFYKEVIGKCKNDSSSILMVGDRIDNDVYPIKLLGYQSCLLLSHVNLGYKVFTDKVDTWLYELYVSFYKKRNDLVKEAPTYAFDNLDSFLRFYSCNFGGQNSECNDSL